eukprot:m.299283 g.299283  ORF g.299283 m.299283 type:complete len:100 (+) comp15868_c2_seq5:278-577(+)
MQPPTHSPLQLTTSTYPETKASNQHHTSTHTKRLNSQKPFPRVSKEQDCSHASPNTTRDTTHQVRAAVAVDAVDVANCFSAHHARTDTGQHRALGFVVT